MDSLRQTPPAAKATSGTKRKARVPIGQKLAIIFSVYLLWLSYTIATTPGLKTRVVVELKRRLKSLQEGNLHDFAFLGNNHYAQTKSDSTVMNPADYRRIPCGLIAIDTTSDNTADDNQEEDVLPLPTAAILRNKSGKTNQEMSTLHARALNRYPQLRQYIQKSDGTILGIIPAGTFRLRMGSVEGTIGRSPELRIINDGDDEIDFVLGTTFWKDHSAEFGDDELFLSTIPATDSTTTATEVTARVMVPYLSMRSNRMNLEL